MTEITIIGYKPEYRPYFGHLNRAWLNKYFELEPIDEWVLDHPEEAILQGGGTVLFAGYNGQIIGTVALKVVEPGTAELTKMAVDEAFQGLGAGKLLCSAAIKEAAALQFDRLILYSNRKLEKAIGIYRKLGFREIPVEKGVYNRADIKMELDLAASRKGSEVRAKWFGRKFDFGFDVSDCEMICHRLKRAPLVLKEAVTGVPEAILAFKPGGRWSIKEHLGHLSVLEPLWRIRFQDIREQRPVLTPADLDNTATFEARFNNNPIRELLTRFDTERNKTLLLLDSLDPADESRTSLHPRLQLPMRIVDLAYFVAEHDDHHIARVRSVARAATETNAGGRRQANRGAK